MKNESLKNIKKILITTCLSVTAFGANAQSGSAYNCPNGKFCLWQHPGYTGMLVYSSNPQRDLGIMDDRATGLWNRTPYDYCLFQFKDFGGHAKFIKAGEYSQDIRYTHEFPGGGNWNDRASSFKRC